MTATVAWTIDRTSLSLSGLVIDSDVTSTYLFADGGVGRPGTTPRETLATPSPFLNGQALTAVVKDRSTLPAGVLVQAASWSAVDTAIETLETALAQFTYTVTEVKGSVTKIWTASPATIGATDGLVTPNNVSQFYQGLTISIPVYPVAS